MKTKEEILKEKGITELTAFHAYPYLYRATIEAMYLYAQQQTEELRKENEEWKKRQEYLEDEITRLRELLERAKDELKWAIPKLDESPYDIDLTKQLLADIEKLNPKP